MKIQIASDLHLEFLEQQFPDYRIVEPADADVLVLAGDIHRHAQAIAAFRDWPVPVIYVHGNHEGYGADFAGLLPQLRTNAQRADVHYLENDELILDGVRFLGCCLWTDYCLQGKETQAAAMKEAARCMKDHEAIYNGEGKYFMPQDALKIHTASRAWLSGKLDESFSGPTVVVTHHAPHQGSIHPRYAGDIVNSAFVTDLTPLLAKATLWIHGHVHDSFDYRVNGTRIIANPRGYAKNRLNARTTGDLVWENPGFDARLVAEV
jgi:DNA repair exonuclease SbcCD nuclease subunit